jgi:hypothetical protein
VIRQAQRLFSKPVAQHDEVPDKQALKAMRALEVAAPE